MISINLYTTISKIKGGPGKQKRSVLTTEWDNTSEHTILVIISSSNNDLASKNEKNNCFQSRISKKLLHK